MLSFGASSYCAERKGRKIKNRISWTRAEDKGSSIIGMRNIPYQVTEPDMAPRSTCHFPLFLGGRSGWLNVPNTRRQTSQSQNQVSAATISGLCALSNRQARPRARPLEYRRRLARMPGRPRWLNSVSDRCRICICQASSISMLLAVC